MYDRSALVLDADGSALAELSLSLISTGLTPLYARDLDELVLLSREYGSRVGAVLAPADGIETRLPALIERIVEPLGLRPASVVPVGPRVTPEAADALARQGLRWALWRPFEAPDLRFVVAQVLSNSDPEERRLHARIPCSVPAQLDSPRRQAAAVLKDLSPGGCFAALADPFPRGGRIRVGFEVCGGQVSIGSRVAWTTGPDTPEWHDAGIGIEFLEMPDDARALLTRHVEERLGRYRI